MKGTYIRILNELLPEELAGRTRAYSESQVSTGFQTLLTFFCRKIGEFHATGRWNVSEKKEFLGSSEITW